MEVMAMPLINGFVAWALNLSLQKHSEGVVVNGEVLRVEEIRGVKEFVLNGRIIGPVEAVMQAQGAECARGWIEQETVC